MNVCLIGDGLVSLALAKALINKKIKVIMYHENIKKKPNSTRTIGISSDNISFFEEKILKIKKKLIWGIDEIEICSDNFEDKKILNFHEQNNKLFSIIKNNDLYKILINSLKKNKNFKKIKIINKSFYSKIFKNKKFDLILNLDANNVLSRKIFYNKISKNYESKAYATIISHNKLKNKKAVQIFTKFGPLAFLPISNTQTSIVYSIKNKSLKNFSNLTEDQLKKLILKSNHEYKINSINKFESFKLNSKTLRNYYNKNILAFGDLLHQIHPLSGQGFNMSLRDIKTFLNIINEKKNLGLPLDNSVYQEFENKTKHLNLLFASGNDLIYEFFNYDNYFSKFFLKKIFTYLNNSKLFNKMVIKYGNKGLSI